MASPPTVDVNDLRWTKISSLLQHIFTCDGQAIVPKEILHIISCGCKSGCKSAKCNCTKFGLPCTEFCKCRGEGKCENIVSGVPQEELSGGEESEDNEQEEDAYE